MDNGRKRMPVPSTYDRNPKEWTFMHKITPLFCLNASTSYYAPTITSNSMETKNLLTYIGIKCIQIQNWLFTGSYLYH